MTIKLATAQEQQHLDIVSRAIAKAWRDPGFRSQLVADPKASLEALGARLDGNAKLVTIEDTADVVHFVIPNPPTELHSLSDDDLVTAAAEKTVYQHEMQWIR